ncbi:MAG: hypothetical protein LN413_00605 [Candidatus Thermoplasmatota archaeon]|nr:hypothetical protein [Candidatus Thermoplasmatota archaeon]
MGSERGQSHGVYTYDSLIARYVAQRGLRLFAGSTDPDSSPEDVHDGDFWWDGTDVSIWDEGGGAWITLAGGAGAPAGASYVTMAAEGGLTNESVLGPDVIMADVIASRPAFATEGRLFYATDEGIVYRDTGAAWVKVAVHEYAELDNRSHTLSAGDHSGSLPEATVSFDTVAGHDHDGTDSKAFVYGVPTAISEGDTAADGVATTPARLDHLHGSPSTWAPTAHKAAHVSGGGDAFAKNDVLVAAAQYLDDIADPSSDAQRIWLEDAGGEIRYWDDAGTPVLRTLVDLALTQTLADKTLTQPTIGDFVNATHDHADAAGGGNIGANPYTITGNWDVSGIAGRIVCQTGAGAPTHSDAEGTLYWDTTNNIFYVNDDGATAWTLVGPGGGAAHTLDSATHTDVAAITEGVGDILVWNGTNWVDLNVGTDGLQLTADSGQTEGVAWAAAGGADPTPHPFLNMGG